MIEDDMKVNLAKLSGGTTVIRSHSRLV